MASEERGAARQSVDPQAQHGEGWRAKAAEEEESEKNSGLVIP